MSNMIRVALSEHDMESPLSADELRTLAGEMEESLIANECQFSHPDWRYVDGLRSLATLIELGATDLLAGAPVPAVDPSRSTPEQALTAAAPTGGEDIGALLEELASAFHALPFGLPPNTRCIAARARLDAALASLGASRETAVRERDALREASRALLDTYDSGGGADEWAIDRAMSALRAALTPTETPHA